MTISIRKAQPRDVPAIVALNDSEVPHVGRWRRNPFESQRPAEEIMLVAKTGERLVGLILAMTPDADYDSPNFIWFRGRVADLLYVDRIVVAPGVRGHGVGRRLYAGVSALAPPNLKRIGCEVNVLPPNPKSMDFHTALGFGEAGRQPLIPGRYEVAYLVCEGTAFLELKGAADTIA